ncbi:uncharacterized protein DS421_16g526300 [Arachis hypogaea]|nr:uncharacterized protein DS421_16g526300 [Arachis hypogaea]
MWLTGSGTQALSHSRLQPLSLSPVSHSSSLALSGSSVSTVSNSIALVVAGGRSNKSLNWSSSRALFRYRLLLSRAPSLRSSSQVAEAAGPGTDGRCHLLVSSLAVSFLPTVSFHPAVSQLRATRSWS